MLFHDPKGTDPILVDGYDSYEISIAETIELPLYDFKDTLTHAAPSQLKEVLARLCVTAEQDKARVDYAYKMLWELTKPTPSSYRVRVAVLPGLRRHNGLSYRLAQLNK